MIDVKNVSKNFGKTRALKNVSLRFGKGQCIALIGPNGCGKTTLIKSILGLVVPTSGQILFRGKDINDGCAYRNNIGYMPQIGRYPENMSIGQVIETIKHLRQNNVGNDEDLMRAFQLPSMADKRMRTLSGGTTQKVSATLAFLFNPDVLILDEPTAGLDPVAAEILKEKIISEREKGKLILITSHLLSELDDLVSEIIFMQEGEVMFHKPLQTLLDQTGEEKISKSIAKILKDGASGMKPAN